MANEILKEQELESEESEGVYVAIIPGAIDFTEEEIYTVYWDGTAYNSAGVCLGEGAGVALGNTTLPGGSNTGEPFLIEVNTDEDYVMVVALNDTEPTTHTIAIYDTAVEDDDTVVEDDKSIVLYDRTGAPVTYTGIETITTDTPTEDVKAVFTRGQVIDGTEIELQLENGDQRVSVPDGYLVKEATIKKPNTLLPQNIKKNVVVAGVLGEFAGEETEKTVELSMADGDQVVEADEDTVMTKVIVKKPDTLVPENIVEGVDVAGVVGNLKTEAEITFSNEKKVVIFYDYDGTIIEKYELSPDVELKEYPTPPEHEGLVFVEWNHSLESINSNKICVDVGATYRTDDGSTRLYIDIPSDGFSLTLNYSQTDASGVTVYWGDGASDEKETTGVVEISHTYTNGGSKTIRLVVNNGTAILGNPGKTSGAINNFFADSISSVGRATYCLKRVEIGDNIEKLDKYCFCEATNILVTIPSQVELGRDTLGSYLEFVVIPKGTTYFNESVTGGVSLSETVEQACVGTEDGARVNHISFPNNVEDVILSIRPRTSVGAIIIGSGASECSGSVQSEKFWCFSDNADCLSFLDHSGNYVEEFYGFNGNSTESPTTSYTQFGPYRKIVFPKSLKKLSGFKNCDALEYINSDNAIETIDLALWGSDSRVPKLRKAIFPALKEITSSIRYAVGLECLKFSNKVSNFYIPGYCYSLKNFDVPHGITIFKKAFFGSEALVTNLSLLGDDLVFQDTSFAGNSKNPFTIDIIDIFCKTKIESVSATTFSNLKVNSLIFRKKDAILENANLLAEYSGATSVYISSSLYDDYSAILGETTIKKIEENYDICGDEADIEIEEASRNFLDSSKNYYTLLNTIAYEVVDEEIDNGYCCCYSYIDKNKYKDIIGIEVV